MKIRQVLKESPAFKSKKWQEGYYAFWDGVRPEACPYEDEEDRAQWVNGWQYGSQEE